MKKICSVEGCNNSVFGKHFCKYHYPKSISKKTLLKSRGYTFIAGKKAIDLVNRTFKKEFNKQNRDNFFISIWKKRKHYSEVSGTYLGNVINSMFFHHILPKRNYKEAEFDEENIILLTPKEHAKVELNIFAYEEINKRRIYLKLKYAIL